MKRKMAMIANQVKIDDEDESDILFWQAKTDTERLAEVTRLRVNYYTWLNDSYPAKIAKVITKRTL